MGLVLGAIALLHVGLGLVLTRSARHEIESIESGWTADELAEAQAPGVQPETTGPEYTAWSRQRRLHEDALRLEERHAQVNLFRLGLGASWLAQTLLVLWRTWRTVRRSR